MYLLTWATKNGYEYNIKVSLFVLHVNLIIPMKAAILHDTVEDTSTTFDEVESRFGPEVRQIVSEVTDDKNLPKLERKRLQIVHAKTCRFV